VNEPRELFGGGFLIALRARQFGLIVCLSVNDRKDELGDRLDLMAMRLGVICSINSSTRVGRISVVMVPTG
jgi:hypothetical protein